MMILDKIDLDYKEAVNPKSKKFTPNHTIFDCVITYNKKSFKFEYQCNVEYEKPTIERVMECLILDMDICDEYSDIKDFAKDFGYEFEDAKRIYKICGKTSKAIHRMFTDTEITEINDDLYYCS